MLREIGIEKHLRKRNLFGENVLHLVSRFCNPEMFRLLVPYFKDGIFQTDDEGYTALDRIILNPPYSQDRYSSTIILLSQSHVDWKRDGQAGLHNALRAAVQICDLDMCCILICVGRIDSLLALTFDGQSRPRHESPNGEGKLLNELADLFHVEDSRPQGNLSLPSSSRINESILHLAHKRYNKRFGAISSSPHPTEANACSPYCTQI